MVSITPRSWSGDPGPPPTVLRAEPPSVWYEFSTSQHASGWKAGLARNDECCVPMLVWRRHYDPTITKVVIRA